MFLLEYWFGFYLFSCLLLAVSVFCFFFFWVCMCVCVVDVVVVLLCFVQFYSACDDVSLCH